MDKQDLDLQPDSTPPQPIPGLTPGRMVHYVDPALIRVGDNGHRAAVITRVWDDVTGLVQLIVFYDGDNDGHQDLISWKTSRLYSEEPRPDTWHFIERS